MTLEELLLKLQGLQATIGQVKSERLASHIIWDLEASLNAYKLQLADFILEHASEIISWDRQRAVRLSILDDNEW